MCGGFNCSKSALAALNVLYLIVSFVLIGVASYAKAAAIITSLQLAGGIIASGLFLFFIALLGLFAASKHHQVLLFFYVVVLFLLFLIQFGVSIACLALSHQQEQDLLKAAWDSTSDTANKTRNDVQEKFNCCGWDHYIDNIDILKSCHDSNAQGDPPVCTLPPYEDLDKKNSTTTNKTPTADSLQLCPTCNIKLTDIVDSVMVATGGIGLFFSFTEMLGVYLAIRFRNQKDPSANPSQFL